MEFGDIGLLFLYPCCPQFLLCLRAGLVALSFMFRVDTRAHFTVFSRLCKYSDLFLGLEEILWIR